MTVWQHIFEWLQGGYGQWVCEDAVIGVNPNGTHHVTLGYRNQKTKKTRLFWSHIDNDEFICLGAEDFIGVRILIGVDMTCIRDGTGW